MIEQLQETLRNGERILLSFGAIKEVGKNGAVVNVIVVVVKLIVHIQLYSTEIPHAQY
jgi:hypothetical protein